MNFEKNTLFESSGSGFHSASERTQLSQRLGVGSVVFMVVAGAAPLGAVVAAFPIVVSSSHSTVSPLFFLIATLVLTIFSVGFSRMTALVSNAGAFYSYIQAGMGRMFGVGSAMLALGTYIMLFLAIASYIGAATAGMISYFNGPELPWWMWTSVWLLLTSILAYRDVELSSKVLGFVLVVETVLVLIVDAAIVAHGGKEGISATSFSPAGLLDGVPSLGIMFAFFAFTGFEATAVFRNEAKDPERTIPRATYIAVIGIGVFYMFSAWAMQLGVGNSAIVVEATSNPERMVLDLAANYVSPLMQTFMQIFLITSLFAAFLTFHNVLARYIYTMGSKGVLPRSLGQVNHKHLAPSRAALTVTFTVGLILVCMTVMRLDPVTQIYTWFSGVATLGVVLLMALTSLAVLMFFWCDTGKRKINGSIWVTFISPLIALVCLSAILCLVVSNFDLLVGGAEVAVVLIGVMVALFLLGLARAMFMRLKKPKSYDALID